MKHACVSAHPFGDPFGAQEKASESWMCLVFTAGALPSTIVNFQKYSEYTNTHPADAPHSRRDTFKHLEERRGSGTDM